MKCFERAIFVWPWKMVSISVCYLLYQKMPGWKEQDMDSSFSAKENPNMEKALFDWPVVLQYDVKAISRNLFGHEVYSAERSLNQPKARCVCIHSINQSKSFISVWLLFLFCFVCAFSFQGHMKIALKFKPNLTSLWPSQVKRCNFTPNFSSLAITQTNLLFHL